MRTQVAPGIWRDDGPQATQFVDKPGDTARTNLDDGDVKPAVIEVLP